MVGHVGRWYTIIARREGRCEITNIRFGYTVLMNAISVLLGKSEYHLDNVVQLLKHSKLDVDLQDNCASTVLIKACNFPNCNDDI